jgi:phosphatidylinositol-3-phosphatase
VRLRAAKTEHTIVKARALLVALLVLVVVAPGGTPPLTHASANWPCGKLPLASTSYSHVIWIWMENHSYDEIIGSAEAPYINSLAAQCGLATNYHSISHPSLPNYIAATSGLPLAGLARFRSDCNPAPGCSTAAPSIFGQLGSWKAYEESMPGRCDRSNAGDYAVRHDPPPYYTALSACARNDVGYGQLARDLARHELPAFSFLTPNLIDDMHDGTIPQGDGWLRKNLPPILRSREYRGGKLVVIVTWDEGEGGASERCATGAHDAGCHVATIVVSPSTRPGTRSATLFNHYSLLGSTERLLGVSPLAEAAAAHSMLPAFNL